IPASFKQGFPFPDRLTGVARELTKFGSGLLMLCDWSNVSAKGIINSDRQRFAYKFQCNFVSPFQPACFLICELNAADQLVAHLKWEDDEGFHTQGQAYRAKLRVAIRTS